MKPGGEVLKSPFEINHITNELEDLVSVIKSYDAEVRVILEDTGHYHLPVVSPLVENGIFVCTGKRSSNEEILFTKPSPRKNGQN